MVLAHWYTHLGRVSPSGSIRTVVRRSISSGILGLPQSRPCEKLQWVVTMRPTAPAARALGGPARVAAAEPVDLEEQLGVGGDDLFDRLAGKRGKPHRGATGGGG